MIYVYFILLLAEDLAWDIPPPRFPHYLLLSFLCFLGESTTSLRLGGRPPRFLLFDLSVLGGFLRPAAETCAGAGS